MPGRLSPTIDYLDNRFVGSASRSSTAEEEIYNKANNREEEDKEAPEDLIQSRASRLENLEKSNDIKNQDNQPDYSTSTAVFPSIAMTGRGERLLGQDEREEGELNEEAEGSVEHVCGREQIFREIRLELAGLV